MIELLFLSILYFFIFDYFFFFLILLFIFFVFNNLNWGLPFIFFNSNSLILVFLSVVILGIVYMSEMSLFLNILSSCLILLSIFFFISSNIFYLYLFFEFSGFPIAIMILSYGYQIEKVSSAYYLFFYTFICSLPFFFFLFNMDMVNNNFMFDDNFSWEMMILLFALFLVKFPVYFFHLWLPKAHVEAPTTASMLLAGLLLKLGTGGFLRILGSSNFFFNGILLLISFLGMFISGIVCFMQSDLKALAAFSSINHMSFVLMSLILFSSFSIWSSVVIMLSHGFISTLMFYFIGEFFHIKNTRLVYFLNSVSYSGLFLVSMISLTWLFNGGIPPSISFISEFMSITVLFGSNNFFFIILFFYFFNSFYYCLYFISLNFLGGNFMKFNIYSGLISLFFLVSNINMLYLIFI